MNYTHIETYIERPSYRVNIVENKNGLRLFQLEFYDEAPFYSTQIEKINDEIERYLAYKYTVEGNDI